jgi:hypothetical protein
MLAGLGLLAVVKYRRSSAPTAKRSMPPTGASCTIMIAVTRAMPDLRGWPPQLDQACQGG